MMRVSVGVCYSCEQNRVTFWAPADEYDSPFWLCTDCICDDLQQRLLGGDTDVQADK